VQPYVIMQSKQEADLYLWLSWRPVRAAQANCAAMCLFIDRYLSMFLGWYFDVLKSMLVWRVLSVPLPYHCFEAWSHA
jgi:hypothetical protein